MKITIKTLQQTTFKMDVEPEKTVKELKAMIEKDHGSAYSSANQKLIYSGKILADENKLAEYNIDEKKFVVLMITRPPPKPKQEPEPELEKGAASKKDTKSKDDKHKSTNPNITQSSSSSSTSNTTTTTTAPAASTISNAPPTPRAPSSDHNPPMSEHQMMASRLNSLMMQPQLRQMQELIQQSPHLLSSTMEALAVTDPEVYNFMTENPDVFVNALNHPPLPREQGSRTSGSHQRSSQQGANAGARGSAAVPATGPYGGGMDQLLSDVSEHDRQAIERLKELGFAEYLAVQAYLASNKDEQLAANLLFQMDES